MQDTNQFLVVLDGARGAGKSTTSELLKKRLDNTVFVGLDLIRNLITNVQATDDFNRIAFGAIFALAESFLSEGINVVIDSGVTEPRVQRLIDIAEQTGSHIFLYHLTAPKDVLWTRISERGKQRGRMPNPDRFEYTFTKQQSKDFSKFVALDTTTLSPQEISNRIVSDLSR